jgi:hypothetical protein
VWRCWVAGTGLPVTFLEPTLSALKTLNPSVFTVCALVKSREARRDQQILFHCSILPSDIEINRTARGRPSSPTGTSGLCLRRRIGDRQRQLALGELRTRGIKSVTCDK